MMSMHVACASWRFVLAEKCLNCHCREKDQEMFGHPHDHSMIMLDTETTGIETPPVDAIIEIGMVAVHDGKIVDEFESLIFPGNEYRRRWPECKKFHGIGWDEVVKAPSSDVVSLMMYDWMEPHVKRGAKLQAFNIMFDKRMLDAKPFSITTAASIMAGKSSELWGECAMTAMRTELKAQGIMAGMTRRYTGTGGIEYFGISLNESCKMMGIERTRVAHRAINDASDAAKLYLEVLKRRSDRRNARGA